KAEREEEFTMLARKNPMIREAYSKLQVMSEDEATRMLYEARLKAQRDDYSRMQGAHQEGHREGLEEGVKKVARNLKAIGMPIGQIVQATGLTGEQINEL
ncbi:MAG: Rpn family recombination-promoting nuclease/putative transposase, partial [Treponema sp.]|nr:Rpn family recombination-promoting nuclease/putative transposase [Treponema sp.]